MNKFLAVSWAFPPVILPRSLQVARTLKILRENGWQASILTVETNSIKRVFKTDPGLGAEYEGLFPITAVPSPEDWLAVRAVWRFFPTLSHLPDPRSVWIPAALRAGRRLLSSEEFSGIMSFAQPWSDHVISRQLSKEFHLPWIAHFSDPWSDSPYYQLNRIFAKIRREMELTVIRDADAIIFVSEETRSLVMKKYPQEWKSRAHVIPHCFEPLQSRLAGQTDSGEPLRLVYTGGFYGQRTPLNLFKSIGEMNRVENLQGRLVVFLVGSGTDQFAGQISDSGLEGIVKLSPVVPYHQSLEIAGKADVLLVIDAPNQDVNVFLPSKVVEYLAFRKPIFGITPIHGATANLLRRLESPLVDTDDLDGIGAVLKDLIGRKKDGRLSVSAAFDSVAGEYSIAATTRQYTAVMENHFLHGSPTP